MIDPQCGNCGKQKSEHYDEDELYCNDHTNGDVFSTDPSNEVLLDFMSERFPEIVMQVIEVWRREQGYNNEPTIRRLECY